MINNSEFVKEKNLIVGMKKACCHIFLLLLFSYSTKAAGNEPDTLSIAKSWIQKGKFKKAEKILAAFERTHAHDLNTLWLHAQTAYWAGYNKTFHTGYKKAIMQYPSNYYLKLDYALKLVENGDVKEAIPLLDAYRKYDPSNKHLKLAQAKIAYWEGNYTAALQLLKDGSSEKERNEEEVSLKAEIIIARSPWLKVDADYQKDDQPMQVITPGIETGIHINTLFNPTLLLNNSAFKTDSTSLTVPRIILGNKSSFYNAGVVISAQGGIAQLPNKAKVGVGMLEVAKKSFKHLQFIGNVSVQPYFTTLSSLSNKVIPAHFALSAGWDKLNSWNGKITGSLDRFKDKNTIYNISAWLFAPPFRFGVFQFRMGYAYGYSDSKESRYVSKESLASILTAYSKTKVIAGVYDPYFTPAHQQVNSALLNISYGGKRLLVGINASIGFRGKTDDPYLFLDKNKSNELFVNRGYSHVNFYPHKADAYVLYKIAKQISLKASYTFLTNNFYTSQSGSLSLVIHFWNE